MDLPAPLESGPLEPEIFAQDGSFDSIEGWNKGVRYADYLKAKAIRENNGFI